MVLPSTVAAGPTRMAVHIDAPSAMSAAVVLMAVAAVVSSGAGEGR